MKFSKLCVLTAVLLAVLSCRGAVAAQYFSYFRIARDYAANEEEARKTWIGKEISIEGNVLVSGPNGEGNLVVGLAAESLTLSYDAVVYAFLFEGVPEESVMIEKGRKVRITGTVTEIEKEFWDQKNVLNITAVSSKLVQAQTEEFTHFFRIPDDADRDYDAAKRMWLGKRISLEGQVFRTHLDDERRFIAVELYAKTRILSSIDEVGYVFFINGIPDEAAALKAGQTVRISGKVDSITKDGRVLLTGLVSSLLLF